jgi:hypothetical protein
MTFNVKNVVYGILEKTAAVHKLLCTAAFRSHRQMLAQGNRSAHTTHKSTEIADSLSGKICRYPCNVSTRMNSALPKQVQDIDFCFMLELLETSH